MGAPRACDGRRETARDYMIEAYLLATTTHISDPLALPVVEFNGYLSACGRGELRRETSTDARAHVDAYTTRGR